MRFFIIGYMACGKTTFGKALAEKISFPFIDLDNYISKKQGKSIVKIFQEDGEEKFREIETSSLNEIIANYPDAVIACGGGTPCHSDNIALMNSNGITVFLETSTPVLISRLLELNETRPLLAGKSDEEIRDIVLTQLCDRLPTYMEAKLKWNGDELEDAHQIETTVNGFVSYFPSLFRRE